jgi:hypothetical protein
MHRVGHQHPVDLVRADNLRRDRGRDILLRKPPRGVLREQELPEPALRILQCHAYGVPAVEDGWTVMIAILPDRPARAGAALVEWPAAAPLKSTLSITIAHGRLVSRVPDNGNLA